jgi:hypothetical protein
VSDANAAEQRLQVKTREGCHQLGRKRILAVLVVVVAATRAFPERVKQALVMRLSRVRAKRRVRVWRNALWPGLE